MGFAVVFSIIFWRSFAKRSMEKPSALQKSLDNENTTDLSMMSFILAVCSNPDAITPEKKLQKQIIKKLKQIYRPCRENPEKRSLLIQHVYALSLCKDVTKVCILIIEEFLRLEEQLHGNMPEGFGCMLSNDGENEYLSAYIKNVFE